MMRSNLFGLSVLQFQAPQVGGLVVGIADKEFLRVEGFVFRFSGDLCFERLDAGHLRFPLREQHIEAGVRLGLTEWSLNLLLLVLLGKCPFVKDQHQAQDQTRNNA